MPIAIRSQTSVANATRTNTTINMPAGVQAGDVVVLFVSCGGSTSITPTAPGSLTSVITNFPYSDNSPVWTVNTRVWRYTVLGSGDPTSFTFTHASIASEAHAIAYSGVNTTTPIDVTPTTNGVNNAGSTTATALGVTTTIAGVEIIVYRGSWDGNAITPPSGFTERLDQPVTWVGTRNMAAAGATGNFVIPTGNGGSSPWACILVPLRPAGASIPQGGSTGAISWVGVATGKRNRIGASTGVVTRAGVATGKKEPKAAASSIMAWVGVATGKKEPEAGGSGGISWTSFAIGMKQMFGSSSGVVSRVSSLATGAKQPKGLVTGSLTWVAVAVGKKEPEGSAAGVFTHVGLATGSTPGEAMQGAAIGSIVWTGVAEGKKVTQGGSVGAISRAGTASGKKVLGGSASGAMLRTGVATGSKPGVLPAEGTAAGFLDWIGTASGKLTPIGVGVGSIDRSGVATGKSIPLGSALGLLEKVGVATGAQTGFIHVVVLSVTEETTHEVGISEVPSFIVTIEDASTMVNVQELTQEVIVEEVD